MDGELNRRFKGISGSALKLIAVITMLIDHTAAVLMLGKDPVIVTPIFNILGKQESLYWLMRYVGRIALPIFCFLLVEGFLHTKNRKKYAIRLFLFAVVSDFPFDYAFKGQLSLESQNVFFTLLLGYLGMWAIESFREERLKEAVFIIGLFLISLVLNADYGCTGYGLIILLYLLRENRLCQAVLCGCFMPFDWKTALAFVPIALYNGERGFIKGRFWKIAFYAFYPVHLTVLVLIKYLR